MRLFIAISRRYPRLKSLGPILAAIPSDTIALLGDNPGSEQQLILTLYTHNPHVHQHVYHADWQNNHSHARQLRDYEMIDNCDEILAFTDGTDPWTGRDNKINKIILRAIALSIPLQVYDRHAALLPAQPSLYEFSA